MQHGRAFAFALALAAQAQADVLNVRGPTPDHDQIQDAVLAAVDGDVIRVWPGTYEIFQVAGEALNITAVTPGTVTILGAFRVYGLTAGQVVTISGLVAIGNESEGALVHDNTGSVRLQGCEFTGAAGLQGAVAELPGDGHGWYGARVQSSADVVFVDCAFTGGGGASVIDEDLDWYVGDGGHGLRAFDSTVAVYDAAAHGGYGGSVYDTTDQWGGDGGSGVYATDATLLVAGSHLAGGDGGEGGDGDFPLYGGGDGGNGGHGIYSSVGALRTLDDTYAPGAGGAGNGQNGTNGQPGVPVQAGMNTTHLAGLARHVSAPALATEGMPARVVLNGEPGDEVWLILATDVRQLFDPTWHGSLCVGPSYLRGRVHVGTIGAGGSLTWNKQLPELAPFTTATWHVQGFFLAPQREIYLSPPTALTILDGAW